MTVIAAAGTRFEPAPDPVLSLRDVTKQYSGSPPVRALDEVTLSVQAGDLVAVVGRSGSGKSTLLNLVDALLLATRQPGRTGPARRSSPVPAVGWRAAAR